MDVSNSIAALSVVSSAAQYQQNAGISILKKAMETQEGSAASLQKLLQSSAPPSGTMDISV